MRKPAPMALSVLLATLLAALLLPASAFADDNEDDSPSSSLSKSQAEKQETEDKHKEIEGIYKNPGRISLPPIVIRPVQPKDVVTAPRQPVAPTPNPTVSAASVKNPGGSSSSGSSSTSDSSNVVVKRTSQDYVAVAPKVNDSVSAGANGDVSQTATGTSINPEGGAAIDISGMNPDSKSDAQTFIEAAYVGLGAMAIGALALGITAGTRSIRRK